MSSVFRVCDTNNSVPPLEFFSKVVRALANKYSFMFLEDTRTVDELGISGVDFVTKALSQKYRRVVHKLNAVSRLNGKRSAIETENLTGGQSRGGRKRRKVYGVDLAKFYPTAEIVTEENLIGHHRVRPGGEGGHLRQEPAGRPEAAQQQSKWHGPALRCARLLPGPASLSAPL